MARVDELTGQIGDGRLRRELEAAISDLRRRQRFGLVFEDHVPELATLLGFPLAQGSIVQDRRDHSGKLFRVLKLKGAQAQVQLLGTNGKRAPEWVKVRELFAIKRFGEPIYPFLEPLGEVRRSEVRPTHAVINSENYHALQLLVYLHAGQVDCLYIDPPYNTGARDWKYNNRYVDANDEWRHSKWLSMMERRLRLAKRLLRPDGVLIVTIDEHEVNHLGMLLEQLFPEYLRHMVTIVINPKGTGKVNFARVDEYAFFVCPDNGREVITGIPVESEESGSIGAAIEENGGVQVEAFSEGDGDESSEDGVAELDRQLFRRRGSNSLRRDRPNMFFPIFIDEKKRQVVRVGATIPLHKKPNFSRSKGLRPIWPIDSSGVERCWRFGPESTEQAIEARKLELGRHNKERDSWTINILAPKRLVKRHKTVWWDKAHDAGTHGTSLLANLLGQGRLFPFPKSVYAVRDCLAAVTRNKPNALIVDVFAGSGTTLHATMLLNAADGGMRRTVLVTNNEVDEKTARALNQRGLFPGDREFEEHGIFEQVTMPRCRAVVTGHRPNRSRIPGEHIDGRPFARGFDENVAFFRLNYVDPDSVEIGSQLEAILPLLWLAAGARSNRVKASSAQAPWFIARAQGLAVLLRESRFGAFRKAIGEVEGISNVYLVTDSEEAFADMRSELPNTIEVSMLYRDYLRSFRINTERSL